MEESVINNPQRNENEATYFEKQSIPTCLAYLSVTSLGVKEHEVVRVKEQGLKNMKNKTDDNYFNKVKFLNNGKEFIVSSNDKRLRLFNHFENKFRESLCIQEPNFIYDVDVLCEQNDYVKDNDYIKQFYLCCKDNPIHVYNSSGKLVNSYIYTNHVEKVESPITVKIDPYRLYLYGGMKGKYLKIDLVCDKTQLIDCKNLKYHKINDLVSCFDTSLYNGVYAYGTYGRNMFLVDSKNDKVVEQLPEYHLEGVNSIKFLDGNPSYFLSGGRKETSVYLWDIRNLREPVASFNKSGIAKNFQKIGFCLDRTESHVFCGSYDGTIISYNLYTLEVSSYFYAHSNCVSDVDCHKSSNLLVSVDGTRTYNPKSLKRSNAKEKIEESNDELAEITFSEEEDNIYTRFNAFDEVCDSSSSIKMWDISNHYN